MVAEYTSSYVFAGSTSATETGLLRVKERPCHGLRRTVAKGRNFESSGRASKVHQETFRSTRSRAIALCKFAGWPVYETLGLETSLKLRFFFKGTKQPLARSTPSSMALNTVGTENSSSLTLGTVTRGLESNDDIDCRAKDVSIKVDSATISTQKKKFEVTTEKKKGKKKVREKMNEIKRKEKKATTTKTTRKFAEKTFEVNKCMTSVTEILAPRERRRSKQSLQSSGPTFFSVCGTLLYRRKKKKKKGNS